MPIPPGGDSPESPLGNLAERTGASGETPRGPRFTSVVFEIYCKQEIAADMKLQTSVMRVRNLEQAADWYVQVLGFCEAFRDLRVRARTFVLNGATRITLYELGPDEEHIPTGKHSAYLVFATDDIHAEQDRMRQLGAELSPLETDPGWQLFWITDPDGNKMMVIQLNLPGV